MLQFKTNPLSRILQVAFSFPKRTDFMSNKQPSIQLTCYDKTQLAVILIITITTRNNLILLYSFNLCNNLRVVGRISSYFQITILDFYLCELPLFLLKINRSCYIIFPMILDKTDHRRSIFYLNYN